MVIYHDLYLRENFTEDTHILIFRNYEAKYIQKIYDTSVNLKFCPLYCIQLYEIIGIATSQPDREVTKYLNT